MILYYIHPIIPHITCIPLLPPEFDEQFLTVLIKCGTSEIKSINRISLRNEFMVLDVTSTSGSCHLHISLENAS